MKTIQEQAKEYAMAYPEEIRGQITKAWIDGRNSRRKKEELDLSFLEPQFGDIFIYWLNYKKERKQSYTQSGAEACYRKLKKMSNNNPQVALAIIEQSVANNWAGLFELKNGFNQGRKQTNSASIFGFAQQMCEDDK